MAHCLDETAVKTKTHMMTHLVHNNNSSNNNKTVSIITKTI